MTTVTKTGSRTVNDKGWAWVIVIATFIIYLIAVGINKALGLILLQAGIYFKCSAFYATLPMVIAFVLFTLFTPISIILAEVTSIRRLVILGGLTGSVGIALSSLLVNLPWFIILFGVGHGFCTGFMYTNCLVMLSHYFDQRLSLANGLALAGSSCGQLVWPVVIEFLLGNYGLGGAVLIISGIYSHVCVFGALLRPVEQAESFENEREQESPQKMECTANDTQHHPIDNSEEHDELICTSAIEQHNRSTIQHPETSNTDYKLGNTCDQIVNGLDNSPAQEINEELGNHLQERNLENVNNSRLLNYHRQYDDYKTTNPKDEFLESVHKDKTLSDRQTADRGIFHQSKEVEVAKSNLSRKRAQIMDFSVLRNYVFLSFTLYMFFEMFGITNFLTFLPGVLEDHGIDDYDKAFLMSVTGLGDLTGRLLTGFVADFKCLKRYKLKSAADFGNAINVLLLFVAKPFGVMGIQCFLLGFFNGCIICLTVMVGLDFIDQKIVPRALALALPTEGIAVAIGVTGLASLKDVTGSYSGCCIVCSISYLLAAVLICFLPAIARLEGKRRSASCQL